MAKVDKVEIKDQKVEKTSKKVIEVVQRPRFTNFKRLEDSLSKSEGRFFQTQETIVTIY